MRHETNNEMDLLLRRLGRRQDAFAPGAGDHLDADELSAYAENALPAAARARYTEHLAECSSCRDLVVQLTASAGVVSAAGTTSVAELSGWRKFLASLLSPMVLRYAAPALGLIVVTVIGVMVMRRDRPGEQMSQLSDQARRETVAPNLSPEAYSDEKSPKTVDSVTKQQTEARGDVQPTATPLPEKAPVDREQKTPAAKPEEQTAVAAAPAPPPAKVQNATAEAAQPKSEDVVRKQQEEVKVAAAEVSKKSFELGKSDSKRAEEPAAMRGRTAKNKAPASDAPSPAGAGSVSNLQRDEAERDDKDSSAETRSVAGRRFRRQRGIWTDTAYDPSRDTINLTRGSEHFRSLVADEPAIKNIADQLDGEIIVVWKGRAYRIR
jgi:hypothetical protein